MEFPYGGIKHFPAGTYDVQTEDIWGKTELTLMSRSHAVWYAFKHLSMREWGESEVRLAEFMMPVKPKPTRRLNSLVRRLWLGSWWAIRVMRSLRHG